MPGCVAWLAQFYCACLSIKLYGFGRNSWFSDWLDSLVARVMRLIIMVWFTVVVQST